MKLLTLLTCLLLTTNCYGGEINWNKLVEAVIEVESGGNPNAMSKAGAIGLMQITPIVLEEWNKNSPFKEPFERNDLFAYGFNITVGTIGKKNAGSIFSPSSILFSSKSKS